jgi:hypothetical protein
MEGNTTNCHSDLYYVSVSVAYWTKIVAANEKEAEDIALGMDFAEMTMHDDVTVDVREVTAEGVQL